MRKVNDRESDLWISQAKLVTKKGICEGALQVVHGRIARIVRSAPKSAKTIRLRGAYLAPGFIDLHVWGDPQAVSEQAVKAGTTAFLTTLGPQSSRDLIKSLNALRWNNLKARCLGVHLEGPYLNPEKSGALPKRWMRAPSINELRALNCAAAGRLKLITLAPELPGAMAAIRWCARKGIVASLGHSQASAACASKAVDSGARAVTHIFNGMPAFHHRRPSVLDVGLIDPRLIAMIIADGTHASPTALRLLMGSRSAQSIALVTDSTQLKPGHARLRHGAYYLPASNKRTGAILAGSNLTMIGAVERAIGFGGASLEAAVAMASMVPARLLGLKHKVGTLAVGYRADLTAFDQKFNVCLTVVAGKVVFSQGL